jgi:hypothetical protein
MAEEPRKIMNATSLGWSFNQLDAKRSASAEDRAKVVAVCTLIAVKVDFRAPVRRGRPQAQAPAFAVGRGPLLPSCTQMHGRGPLASAQLSRSSRPHQSVCPAKPTASSGSAQEETAGSICNTFFRVRFAASKSLFRNLRFSQAHLGFSRCRVSGSHLAKGAQRLLRIACSELGTPQSPPAAARWAARRWRPGQQLWRRL